MSFTGTALLEDTGVAGLSAAEQNEVAWAARPCYTMAPALPPAPAGCGRTSSCNAEVIEQHRIAQAAIRMQANALMLAAWQQMHGAMALAELGGAGVQAPLLTPPLQKPSPSSLAAARCEVDRTHSLPQRSGGAGNKKRQARVKMEAVGASMAEGVLLQERLTLLARVRELATPDNRALQVPLQLVMPHLSSFAQDPAGSEHLLALLGAADEAALGAVIEALGPEVSKLSWHQHGHNVIRRLFKVSSQEQRKALADHLTGKVASLAKHKYGCWVLQQALEQCSREMQLKLASELDGCVKSCIESMHGNHVVQKCVELLPCDALRFILTAVEARTDRMAIHKYGCRVIQRLLEHCPAQLLTGMLERILAQIKVLSQDPYGNYVLRHLLEFGRLGDKRRILEAVASDLEHLATDKHASTVVERCFAVAATGEHAHALVVEAEKLARVMLGTDRTGCGLYDEGSIGVAKVAPLLRLVEDRYGNYVVQRFAEHSHGAYRNQVRQMLRDAEPRLRATPRGSKILAALAKEVEA